MSHHHTRKWQKREGSIWHGSPLKIANPGQETGHARLLSFPVSFEGSEV